MIGLVIGYYFVISTAFYRICLLFETANLYSHPDYSRYTPLSNRKWMTFLKRILLKTFTSRVGVVAYGSPRVKYKLEHVPESQLIFCACILAFLSPFPKWRRKPEGLANVFGVSQICIQRLPGVPPWIFHRHDVSIGHVRILLTAHTVQICNLTN